MINFKVGILGAGSIADKIADTLNKLSGFEPYAIASRDLEKANTFAAKHNMAKSYSSYEELINDPDVEMIYIATPHSHHAEQAIMCINAGKPVFVEKAFSYNSSSAREVLKLAEEKKVFCNEAMWIRFFPIYNKLLEFIKKGVIGTICHVTCNLGFDIKYSERMIKPELAGGALLDLGIYPLTLISMLFGNAPAAVSSTCTKLNTGVDAQNSVYFNFKNGRTASVFSTMLYNSDNSAKIYGELGYIEVDNMLCPTAFRVYKDNQLLVEVNPNEDQISGYEYEFMAARDAIITGKLECAEMPHTETLRMMGLMDMLRKSWHYKMPMEENTTDDFINMKAGDVASV